MKTVSEVSASISLALGSDYYLLAPGDYARPDGKYFLPPEVLKYIIDALLFAFAAGLAAGLREGAKDIGKTVGSKVSDWVLRLLGKEADTTDKVTDQKVDEVLNELKSLTIGKVLEPEASRGAETALANILETRFGLTNKRAADVATKVRMSVDKITQ